jgi:hypothetical protein
MTEIRPEEMTPVFAFCVLGMPGHGVTIVPTVEGEPVSVFGLGDVTPQNTTTEGDLVAAANEILNMVRNRQTARQYADLVEGFVKDLLALGEE